MFKYKSGNTSRVAGPALVTSLALSLLAACSTTPVPDYGPRGPYGSVGYSDLKLAPNHYLVSFAGSTASTRDDVEKYLLRRSAEVTLLTGHTHFVLTKRDTERDTSYYGYGYGYDDYIGGPYYPYRYPYAYGGGYGWPATTYSAFAEIIMLDREEAAQNPQAIEASPLLARLQAVPAYPVASR